MDTPETRVTLRTQDERQTKLKKPNTTTKTLKMSNTGMKSSAREAQVVPASYKKTPKISIYIVVKLTQITKYYQIAF